MNLTITADWVMTAAERVTAALAISVAYEEMLPLARLALTLPADPWADYPATLEVRLSKGFVLIDGVSRGGATWWFEPNTDSRIDVSWQVQNQEGQAPLRHEFGHWLALQAGHPGWGDFGHGTPNDPLMQALKSALKTAYFNNFGAAFLGYVPIDFKKDEGREWLWKFKVTGGKMVTTVYDKEA